MILRRLGDEKDELGCTFWEATVKYGFNNNLEVVVPFRSCAFKDPSETDPDKVEFVDGMEELILDFAVHEVGG